jgi:hypothetical protein
MTGHALNTGTRNVGSFNVFVNAYAANMLTLELL